MQKLSRNFLALTLILSIFVIAQPKKAEAGIALWVSGWITLGSAKPKYIATPLGWSLFGAGTVLNVAGVVTMIGTSGSILGLTLCVLDADGAPSRDQMIEYFSKRYSFVDNLESLSNLVTAIKAKAANQTADANGNKMVSLNYEEVSRLMSSADLTDAQLNMIAADLL